MVNKLSGVVLMFFLAVSILILNSGVTIAASNIPSTSGIQTNYQIEGKNVLVEHSFDSVSDLSYKVPIDVEVLEINVVDYKIEDFESYKLISIISADNPEIKYITGSLIDKSGGKYFFIVKNQFNEKSDVVLSLPEGAVLIEGGVVFPKPDEISSDGRKLILKWSGYAEDQILVSYEFVEKGDFVFYAIIVGLVAFLFALYFVQKNKFKKEVKKFKAKVNEKKTKNKKEEEITKNLFEDEKRIIKYLIGKNKKECWTKELVRDLGISKVKLSRKIRSLEQKGIIKKIPYGNENRIRLL